jgi:hypothetical protein
MSWKRLMKWSPSLNAADMFELLLFADGRIAWVICCALLQNVSYSMQISDEFELFVADCWRVPAGVRLSPWIRVFQVPRIYVWRYLGCRACHSTRGSTHTSCPEESDCSRLPVPWSLVGRVVSGSAPQHQFRGSYGELTCHSFSTDNVVHCCCTGMLPDEMRI